MMIAILSPTIGGAAPAPDWLPDGAIAFLDFVNGRYYAGGAVRSVTDVLGGDFDASQIGAGGMLVDFSNDNRAKAIGALFTDLASGLADGCTVVVEANHQNTPYGPYMYWLDAASLDLASNEVDFGAGSGKAYVEDFDELFARTDGGLSSAGIHTVTATLNRDAGAGNREYAIAADAGAFVTQTVTYDPFAPVDTILIGHDGDNSNMLDNTLIRTIALYQPQATPLAISGTPDVDAMVGLAYSAQISATGGTQPYTFSVHAGSLPAGLSIDASTGEVSGSPSGAGVSSGIVIRVTDDDGNTDDLDAFTITVRNSLIRLVDQKNHMGAATFTLAGVNFGQTDASRVIAIAATGAGASHSVDAVTIGGDAAAGVKTVRGRSAAIYYADPAGTSGDIDVTVSTINIFVQFAVFALYGVAASAFDSDSTTGDATTSFSLSVDADDDGIVLAALCADEKTATVGWTGLTEITDFDPNGAANERASTAALMNGAAATVSITAATPEITGASLVAVSFPGA
jgi:hypothetical protein